MEEDHEVEIYKNEARENSEEDDEIDELEEGFMQGYENDHLAECANCKKVLEADIIEEEINGEIYRFCSEKCAEEYENEKFLS